MKMNPANAARDLFDLGAMSAPGGRQMDIETLILENKMNDYNAKIEAKRERLEAAADRADAASMAAYGRADMRESASGIPLGQPILVGHHSEGRHRAAIKRADNAMRASVALDRKAKELRNRADSVGKGGISSDDPAAVIKLKEKIAAAENKHAFMKGANKVIRGAIKAGLTPESPIEDLAPWMEKGLTETGLAWGEGSIRKYLAKDFAGRIGFASYELTNNSANIARMKARVAELEKAATAEAKEYDAGPCKVVEDVEDNRLKMIFEGKPSDEARKSLKAHGFRWAPSKGAWMRFLNNGSRYAAKCVLREIGGE